MAPNLRSSSHAWSNNSRPSTPLGAPTTASTASSLTDSTRPRKQRRTGWNSRVATDPPQDPPSRTQSRLEQSKNDASETLSDTNLLDSSAGWVEPPLREPEPSFADTPWCNVSHHANPVLSSMRPLGTMPSAADLRKVGLAPIKPSVQNISAKKESRATPNGEGGDTKPQTPLTPAEEPMDEPLSTKNKASPDMSAFTSLPVPTSTDVDVDRIKIAVEKALRLALETNNRPVSRGLIRLWETCNKDPFALSILDGICQENPGPRERSAFQSVMRAAWKEVQAEADDDFATAPVLARPRSASSISSLSSAVSLDAETFAPGMAPGAATSRARARGRKAKRGAPKKKEAVAPPSAATAPPQKHALEDEPNPEEEARIKRTRLQKPLPTIVALESQMRSSLASDPQQSNVPSPVPTAASRSQPASLGAGVSSRQRSESPASSDAGDNRRLTPTLTSDNERQENNDFCHNCNGSGQLLCCDGCPNSFHFSCLNPPLDPANPPEGDWFCPKCSLSKPMTSLLGSLDNAPQKDYLLPLGIRDYFTGVATGEENKYDEVVPLPKFYPRRGARHGRYDDPYLLRTQDAKGNVILCAACGRTSGGRQPIIQCDYCPCAFHMDCCDPPMPMPPIQKGGSNRRNHSWMCPNHVWHDLQYWVKDEEGYDVLKRIRRPKRPRMIDVEVLPDEEEVERMEEQEEEGIMYRVSERGLKMDFIQTVKRENEEYKLMKEAAGKYLDYATSEFDKLVAKANAFYSSQKPAFAEEDTTAAILNSRTIAEREAAANLISLAQGDGPTRQGPEDGKIGLLIDQLKANAPPDLPSANTEIASLRALQNLIEQRIQVLNAQSEPPEPAST
ncbi:putative PHD finger domain protein [Aspergillus vadensis CBS 113365]|uniref:PHD finger domain protein n=1 Tax=Aspergillus vadensis (strain CBS 113365 / IMI 142717 / IBT 24658) TaxID=1448311 RepID=A0A319BLT5_ASPVC|nr:PHD finger domain protein [Aspergillus vadensis CBS 113365]PYH73294.1 PHD finger domain protein [Aspergillus vadensis CBS 113365]